MSFIGTPSYPRNTSNGDYGRFHFLDTSRGLVPPPPSGQFSVSPNGNRMVQHMHYPNCQNNGQKNGQTNQQGQGQGQGDAESGMPEYTIEYGEDAVRKALGGNMPDFQAQFQQQYGNMNIGGGGDGNDMAGAFKVSPEQMQMMNMGNSKVAMLPVVLTSDDQGSEHSQSQGQDLQSQNGNQKGEGKLAQAAEASQGQVENQKNPKPVNTMNAMNSIRRGRPVGQVKYGRHIRPSYWNPQAPNPCRKKSDFEGECGNGDTTAPEANETPQNPNQTYAAYYGLSNNGYHQDQASMSPGGAENNQGQMPMSMPMPPQPMAPPQQHMSRARSLPPKKPAVSLCGKCQKCKNLSSTQDMSQGSLLTFPKYSTAGARGYSQKLHTSSNLGQSAKNFRAIRFSSNQTRNFHDMSM